jgi:hypothetical protein
MYPPREVREDTPPPPVNEFAQRIWPAGAWVVFAAVEWARTGTGRQALWKVMMAAGHAINAFSLKLGWSGKKRWTVLGVWLALVVGVAYLTR